MYLQPHSSFFSPSNGTEVPDTCSVLYIISYCGLVSALYNRSVAPKTARSMNNTNSFHKNHCIEGAEPLEGEPLVVLSRQHGHRGSKPRCCCSFFAFKHRHRIENERVRSALTRNEASAPGVRSPPLAPRFRRAGNTERGWGGERPERRGRSVWTVTFPQPEPCR